VERRDGKGPWVCGVGMELGLGALYGAADDNDKTWRVIAASTTRTHLFVLSEVDWVG
jgi:hypothetical protein